MPSSALAALLQIPGLVEHQHPIGVAELPHDVVAQVIPDAIGVPARPREQVLHAVRIAVTGMFGDRPTVLPRQVGQQPEHELPGSAAGLHSRERAAIRSSNLSVSVSHRLASTLWPAATA